MTNAAKRVAILDDPFEILRIATEQLAAVQREVEELARLRRLVIQDLRSQGRSDAQIADKAGLTRGRIHQIRQSELDSDRHARRSADRDGSAQGDDVTYRDHIDPKDVVTGCESVTVGE